MDTQYEFLFLSMAAMNRRVSWVIRSSPIISARQAVSSPVTATCGTASRATAKTCCADPDRRSTYLPRFFHPLVQLGGMPLYQVYFRKAA